MKKVENKWNLNKIVIISIGAIFCNQLFFPPLIAYGEESGKGSVMFQGQYKQEIHDPENPGKVVDPGDSPKTTGDLRIDFVPQFEFWKVKISNKDQVYHGNAQLFHDSTEARGNFIQVSDYRGTSNGWLLQVRQETQFRNPTAKNQELKGAVLSLDQSWTNSTRDKSTSPIVSKDVIKIDHIGETYNLAEAKKGNGVGTWAIEFGASKENANQQKSTLSQRLDSNGNPVLDSEFDNKQMYQNSALSLSIPGATKVTPGAYQTVITWILSELP